METSGEAGSEDITWRRMAQKAYEVGKTHRVAQSLGNEGHPTPGVLQKESVND